jgi:hypothetical protein
MCFLSHQVDLPRIVSATVVAAQEDNAAVFDWIDPCFERERF